MHNLGLIFPPASSCDKLTVQDGSCYEEGIPVTNTILEIKPPGGCCFIPFSLEEGWCSKTLTCEDFGICCGHCSPLPDGNYEIKYSIDPNLQFMVEYNYFRVCRLLSAYFKSLCIYFTMRCDLSKREKELKDKEYNDILGLIRFAQYSAEDCLDVEQAILFYNEASEKLKELGNGNCPTCK